MNSASQQRGCNRAALQTIRRGKSRPAILIKVVILLQVEEANVNSESSIPAFGATYLNACPSPSARRIGILVLRPYAHMTKRAAMLRIGGKDSALDCMKPVRTFAASSRSAIVDLLKIRE